jgi:hypothetical protein
MPAVRPNFAPVSVAARSRYGYSKNGSTAASKTTRHWAKLMMQFSQQ